MEKPPILPQPEKVLNRRWTWALNLLVPGVGQVLSGQKVLGMILASLFVIDFTAMLMLFLHDFLRYLELAGNGKILEGENLEKLSDVYHGKWLLALLGIGLVIKAFSHIDLLLRQRAGKK